MKGVAATYINKNRFTLAGDRTREFWRGQRLFALCRSDGAKSVFIESISFNGSYTTVNTSGENISPRLESIIYQREDELQYELVWEGEDEPPSWFRGVIWVDTTIETTTTTTTTTSEPLTTTTTTTTTTTGINPVLVLHFDETPFVDSSPSGHTVTNNGVARTSSNAKFDDAGRFTQSQSDNILLPNSADWDFPDSGWTAHWWMYIHSHNNDDGIWSTCPNGGELDRGLVCAFGTSAQGTVIRILTASAYQIVTGETVPIGQLVHMAVVNDGTNIKVYRDGNLMTNGTWNHGGTQGFLPPDAGLVIGRFYVEVSGFYCDVTIDEFIITPEVLWTSNFTPPSQESPW